MPKKPFEQPHIEQRTGEPIGRFLRRVRREREESQTAVAEMFGISQSVMSQLELGQALPTEEMTKPLARYLDIPVAEVRRQVEHERLLHEKELLKKRLDRIDTALTKFMTLR